MLTPLFIQLFCNNIYVSLKNEGTDLMKTVQLFYFHFIPTFQKRLRSKIGDFKNKYFLSKFFRKKMKTSFLENHNLPLYDCLLFTFLLCMTLIYAMIRTLWLIMTTHRIWTVTFLTISVNVLSVWKLDVCLFQTENLKMLLQNNCINNDVTSGLK